MNIISRPYIAPFQIGSNLLLEPSPNGGWVVSKQGASYGHTERLGAFTSAEEMIVALSDALDPAATVGQVPTQ